MKYVHVYSRILPHVFQPLPIDSASFSDSDSSDEAEMTLDPSEQCGLMESSSQSEIEFLGETDSLVPRPHLAFRRILYGKAGEGLVSFLT